ncbi:hypothetical protein MYCTH_2304109 [Thermothelomyces thermophilus ATCC 42464]|uniref:Uncharacterized protein n=1 Tax=Thermothelomyces thermophilus (strain ATCC 42464 / BCRC 31852 / DSM 1799) TaxID=573729 RepID=G2QE89_THET4|nr:uncharacterized protein MYCTH_2304109 [Thermothelomyces thermophilus ATCC 42464]AEO57672.1 hypothetical protein MYCTH_2304109 [Thermothelomyces thermophilus ATCC 42464]
MSSLSIRPAERNVPLRQPMLPHGCQTLGSGDSLVIRTNQRLPPISDLLRDVPLPPSPPSSQPPSQKQSYPTILPPMFPTPIPCSPTFFPGAFPTWSASPPRSRSASQQYTQFPPLSRPVDLRRASIPCADRDRDRQRRTTKQQARLRRGSTLSDPGPQPRQHHPPPNNSLTRRPEAAAIRQPAPAAPCETAAGPPKPKRNNQPFTFEQEAFVIYHRVELGLCWAEVRDAFMARWPALKRSVGSLQCAYYRTNLELPVVTPDGLLVLVDPEEEAGELAQMTPPASPGPISPSSSSFCLSSFSSSSSSPSGGLVDEGAKGGSESGGSSGRPREWYKLYRGVAYRTRMVKCRSARISLTERFPEELLDERNDWVREEHRVAASGAGEYTCIPFSIISNHPPPPQPSFSPFPTISPPTVLSSFSSFSGIGSRSDRAQLKDGAGRERSGSLPERCGSAGG